MDSSSAGPTPRASKAAAGTWTRAARFLLSRPTPPKATSVSPRSEIVWPARAPKVCRAAVGAGTHSQSSVSRTRASSRAAPSSSAAASSSAVRSAFWSWIFARSSSSSSSRIRSLASSSGSSGAASASTASASRTAAASSSSAARFLRRKMPNSPPVRRRASVAWNEPSVAASGIFPSSRRCARRRRRKTVLSRTVSAALATAPVTTMPLPATMPGWSPMRFASSLAFMKSVTAPMTLSVGQGDLGWFASGHSAPVTMDEYFQSVAVFSTSSTLSDWSFSKMESQPPPAPPAPAIWPPFSNASAPRPSRGPPFQPQ
mmetsp:Transcript_23937/g.82220  ORF Transcript_23937/g.82220 Transcript_23937/m.82220 type:complete len:316 (+) Transcript_23937:75-1022(+)